MQHTFQTNGILLDDDWCAFFKEHNFLVGLSVDGPRELHDTYRRRPPQDRAPSTGSCKAGGTCAGTGLNSTSCARSTPPTRNTAATVYRFFRDELGAKWVQFIPIVERATEETLATRQPGLERASPAASACSTRRPATSSPSARWAPSNTAASSWMSSRNGCATTWARFTSSSSTSRSRRYFGRHLLCIHAPTCGYGPALEYNGDLYSCDHFVEPRFKLGNIHQTHMLKLVASPEQRKFGQDKRDTLTAQCQQCEVRHLCNGGCPKDRFALSRDGEPGQNYLCAGLELFFTHTRPAMQTMARLAAAGPGARRVMALIAAEDAKRGPYRPCPCGSGEKFRFCHGNRAAAKDWSAPAPNRRRSHQ